MVGTLWVIFRGDMGALLAMDLGQGDAIFLAACIAMGCYSPSLKFLHRGEPMARVTFWTLVTGVGWLFLLSAGRLGAVGWTTVPVAVYGGIAYLAVFTTLITFFIFQRSVAAIGPTRVMSYTYLNPVLVLLIGLGFGEPPPALTTYPGLVRIVGATFLLFFIRLTGKSAETGSLETDCTTIATMVSQSIRDLGEKAGDSAGFGGPRLSRRPIARSNQGRNDPMSLEAIFGTTRYRKDATRAS